MKKLLITAALIFGGLTSASADDLKDNIKQAEALGEEIYNQDIAAWVATDELLAFMKKDKSFDPSRIGGWVSYKDGRRYKTVFVSKDDVSPQALYEVKSKQRDVKQAEAIERDLTKREMRLWKARSLMLAQEFEACPEYSPYNSVVIEKEDDGYFGYLFAATKQHDLIVLGRHYRFDINADATAVLGIHSFSNSCFALPAKTDSGERPVGLMATHLNANHPQEHHVFANLMWDIDLYVSTVENEKVWVVSNGEIEAVD